MLRAALATLVILSPIVAVIAMLALAEWRDRRRQAALARQIRLTDALTEELGAVAAPVVSRPLGRPWRVEMRVPVGRPNVTGRILAITHDTLARLGAAPYELVLTPQTAPSRVATSLRSVRAAHAA